MSRQIAWAIALLLIGLFGGQSIQQIAHPPTALAGDTAQTTIVISDTVQVADAQRLGINLGSHSRWGAEILLKNVVDNPGFEAGDFGMIFLPLAGATASRVQADFWETEWNNDQYLIGQPVGFWNGAAYEIVSGPAAGRTGTITNFIHEDGRYTFSLDGAGPAPNTGDAVFVRKSLPGYYGDAQPFNRADPTNPRPGSPGAQSLELLPPDFSWRSSWYYGMDSYWRDGDRSAGKLQIVDGVWRFEIWARADNPGERLTISFYREGIADFFYERVTLGTNWQHIVREFTVPPGTDPYVGSEAAPETFRGILILSLLRDTDGGRVWVDDLLLSRADQTNPTVFTDNFVQRLQELRPGLVRNWGAQLGSTLDSQLAPVWARRSNGFAPGRRIADNFHYSLHEFLELAAYLGSQPWYVIPPTFTPAEMENLMAYLAAPAGSHPYADLRASLGQTAPWTSVFDTIHLEYGNEMWGANSGSDPFIGATLRGGERLGQVAGDRFAIVRASPHFSAADFNLIIGSQAAYPGRTAEIDQNSDNHDSLALAPYFGILEDWDSAAEIWGPLLARPLQETQANGWVGAAQGLLDAANSDTELSIYEINFHTTDGSAPLEIRNDFVTGLGGGLALPLTMLTYQHDLGIRHQAAFAAAQFSYRMSNGEYVRLWGMLRDLDATGRKRPTWLGVELANRAIRGEMIETAVMGSPTWSQPAINGVNEPLAAPYIRAFAFRDGGSYAVAIFNLHLSEAQTVTLQLPTAANALATRHVMTGTSISADNEDGPNVTIRTDAIADFDANQTLQLEPHSMLVVEWQAANGSATPTPTTTPTPAHRLFLPGVGR